MKHFAKKEKLVASASVISFSMLFLPGLLKFFLPWTILEVFDDWSLLYLLIACFFMVSGCLIGIKTETYKDVAIQALYLGLSLYLSLVLAAYQYDSTFILLSEYFMVALVGMASVMLPALFLHFLRPRVKLSQKSFFAIALTMTVVCMLLFPVFVKQRTRESRS